MLYSTSVVALFLACKIGDCLFTKKLIMHTRLNRWQCMYYSVFTDPQTCWMDPFLARILSKNTKINSNWTFYSHVKNSQLYSIFSTLSNLLLQGAFTYPVSPCVFPIALQFFITYLDWAKPRKVLKNRNAMR